MESNPQVLNPRSWLVVSVVALLALTMGCSNMEVQTHRDSSIAIPTAATYAWGPAPTEPFPAEVNPRTLDPQVIERIRKAIEAGLAAKGFRQGPAEQAEFLAEYRVGVWSHLEEVSEITVHPQGSPMRAYSGAFIGGPFGPPPSVTTYTAEVAEAHLLLTLVDRATGKVAYRALAQQDNVTRADGSERAINDAVDQLLKGLR